MIQAQSADGVIHQFPDDTNPAVVDRVMKQYAEGIKVKKGSFTGASMDTFATDILGSPGDLESLVRAPLASLASKVGVSPRYAADIARPLLPTSSSLLRSSGNGPEVAAHPIGALTGHAIAAAPLASAGGEALGEDAINALSVRRAQRGAEAATQAAEATKGNVSDIGSSRLPSEIGDTLRKTIDRRLTRLETGRTAATTPYYDAVKQAKGVVKSGLLRPEEEQKWNEAIQRLEKSASDLYKHASQPINEFQASLGRDITGDAAGYAPGFRVDTQALPAKAFKSRDSVRALKSLSGGDTEWVEANARAHAASQLDALVAGKTPDQAAQAVEGWLAKPQNKDWLSEVPGTKKAVQEFAATLKQAANKVAAANAHVGKVRMARRIVIGSGLAAGMLMSERYVPWYWLRHIAGAP